MASISKRPDGRWRARYRDANGKEHAKHFDRKADAQRWVDEVTASIVTGRYVDPNAGGARHHAEQLVLIAQRRQVRQRVVGPATRTPARPRRRPGRPRQAAGAG